jgi:hypothetical protein
MSQNENLPQMPMTTQEWADVDPAIAFHLIERYADNWAHAGMMIAAWADARSTWLPIDSAPKDGSWVLVAMTGYPDTVRWVNGGWHDGSGGRMTNPRHWMPIPPLPEVKPC